jgi:para-nitrobenzyl esterase
MDRSAGDIETVCLDTPNGRLAGQRFGDVFLFKGIPYAKPPLGPLRWRMPEPAEPWTGIRDATRFGPICPQAPTQIELLMGGTLGEQSEDCLNLNVWTPGCDDAKRPVMVWIHGGAFVIGAGSQGIYNGAHLAKRDCVIVTINYRLGAFGFLNLLDATDGQLPGTGAEGIADQILALHWIKQNIACFGGDPDNVTIFGESAGAMSVATLMSLPVCGGLFHKAIAQSGGAHIGHDRERSVRVARAFLNELGTTPGDFANIRDLPCGELVRAQIALLADARDGRDSRKLGQLVFQPTIDGSLIPQRPLQGIRAGSAQNVPLIAGTTKEEWKLFTAANARLRLMSRKNLEERVQRFAGEAAAAMLAAYSEGTTFDRFNAMMTDRAFTIPMVRMLEAQSAFAPAYAYRFDWCSRLLGGILGSCHALELGFVFGTHAAKLAGAFFGNGAAAEALSNTMMDGWVQFARTGNPETNSTGPWPRYDTETRSVMIFGDGAPHIAQRPNEARRLIWDSIPERKLGP